MTASPVEELSRADVLLLPSIEEGSALVTYEAQVAGCVPLVSSAAGAMLDHDVHGLAARGGRRRDPHRPARPARRATPSTLERLRTGALAHAPELSWAAAAQSLLTAYGSPAAVVENGPLRAGAA